MKENLPVPRALLYPSWKTLTSLMWFITLNYTVPEPDERYMPQMKDNEKKDRGHQPIMLPLSCLCDIQVETSIRTLEEGSPDVEEDCIL